jgi:hypothetical protein
MSQKLIDIQHHKHLLQKRDKLDKQIRQEDLLEYRDKAWRWRQGIDSEKMLEWLISQINNECKHIQNQ